MGTYTHGGKEGIEPRAHPPALEKEPVSTATIHCSHCNRVDISAWLRTKRINIQPAAAALLNSMLRPGAQLPRELDQLGVPPSSFRFRMRKKGLPGPSRWLHLAHAIHAVHTIQNHPDRSLLRIAVDLGYADHSALSHAVQRNFGITPSELRGKHHTLAQLLELWWVRQQKRSTQGVEQCSERRSHGRPNA